MDLREDKSVDRLLAMIQLCLNCNSGSIYELIELAEKSFSDEDYFHTAIEGSRELITLMMKTILGLNEKALCVDLTVHLHEITVPFLEQANSSSEEQSKMVLDVMEEIYRGEVLADYLLFCSEFSWKIAQQLNSVSDYRNVLTWIRRLSASHNKGPEEAKGRLNYLRNGDV